MSRHRRSHGLVTRDDPSPRVTQRHLTIELDRRTIDPDARTVEISFSSEAPVERWFGTEILAHGHDNVRLGRLNNGGALLVEHDRRDQVGVVVSARIDSDGVGRATVRFGKSRRAEEIFQDVRDGIRRLVSVGYRVHQTETTNEGGGVESVRVTDWEPYELSLVSIPADESVGVGRNDSSSTPGSNHQPSSDMNREQIIARLRELGTSFEDSASTDTLRSLLPQAERNATGGENTGGSQGGQSRNAPAGNQNGGDTTDAQRSAPTGQSPAPAPQPATTGREERGHSPEDAAHRAVSAERQRTAGIQAIADQARQNGVTLDSNRAIAEGVSIDQFRETAYQELLSRRTDYAPGNGPSPSERRDLGRYSILRGLGQIMQGRALDGIEAEMQQEAEREARESGIQLQGNFHIPSVVLSHGSRSEQDGRRDMTATGGSGGDQGGTMVPTDHGSFIEQLYARMVLRGLGTQYLTGLNGNLDLPKLTAGSTIANKAETGAGDESSPETGVIQLSPKRATTYVEVSRQLMLQSSPSVESVVRNDLATALALIIEQRAIAGSGSNNQPLGILGTNSIGSVAGGTNGAAPTYADIVDLETKVAVADADIGSLAYLTNPKVRGKLKTTSKAGTEAQFVWSDGNTPLNGYRSGVTTQVPSDLDKGTSTGVCSAIVFGNFSDLIIAQWGGIDIMANPYAKDTEGLVRLTVNAFHDNAVRRAGSFAAMQDALTD